MLCRENFIKFLILDSKLYLIPILSKTLFISGLFSTILVFFSSMPKPRDLFLKFFKSLNTSPIFLFGFKSFQKFLKLSFLIFFNFLCDCFTNLPRSDILFSPILFKTLDLFLLLSMIFEHSSFHHTVELGIFYPFIMIIAPQLIKFLLHS